MEIQPNKYYKPMQIAEAGWIVTPGTKKLLSVYNYVLKLIKRGKLPARNYAEGEKGQQYYKVLGSDISKYIKKDIS